LQNIFQLFDTIGYQFFRKKGTLFATKARFSNEFSPHWQEFFDGDSFVSQSRFDTFADRGD